jgi:hypothetical protein
MAFAPLLYNITFDSQTRILYFLDKAGHEIYHCEIPSPAPALPTVSQQFIYPNSDGSGYSSPPNFTRVYFDSDGSRIPYDSNVKYGLRLSSSIDGRLSIANSNNWVAVSRSGGSGYVTIFRLSLYICSSSSATVITVYDSSNNPYNAFQYTSDGTDYYYVLDGVQTDWTDDLESIGYHVLSVAYLGTQDKFVNWNAWVWLFENNSASRYVDFDPNKSYIFDSAYTVNGSKVDLASHTITIGRPGSTIEILGLIDSYSGFTAYKVYYHAIPNS